MPPSLKAVILAGGSGSRLWPLSREQFPKQFLTLGGGRPLIEETIQRLSPLIPERDVWLVTGSAHAKGGAYQLLNRYNLICEPNGRNTAPAIAVAAAVLAYLDPSDPILVVLPADHVIRDVAAFRAKLQLAIKEAEAGALVTFGIWPDRPETGYGYIQVSPSTAASPVSDVLRFVEKPDEARATAFVESGEYYWNSGMFVWRASVILEEIEKYVPEIAEVIEKMRKRWMEGQPWQVAIHEYFAEMPSISIDYGVLEHSDRVRLIPCDIGWSDIGSWDAVYDLAEKDGDGNALLGNVIGLDCRNSLLKSESRLLAAVGLEDVIAVETDDAVLIVKRGQSQRVKDIVEAIKKRGGSEYVEHKTVQRPWGKYTVLDDKALGYKLKRIEVNPGCSLSLQRHQHRSEHWVVVSGTATVTRNGETYTVAKNESTFIPIGVKHRLENRGKIPLIIVEVQVGEYLEEDDIERFDDEYGRSD